jgi:AraC-like DNA-binding protein
VVTITSAAGSTSSPERSCVEIHDPDEAAAFLESAYGVRLRLSNLEQRPDGGALLEFARIDAGALAVERIRIAGEVKAAPDALEKVRVLWVQGGRIESDCEGQSAAAGPGDLTMTAQHDMPCEAYSQELTMTAVSLDPATVSSVATGLPPAHAPLPVRFCDFRPVDAAAARMWKDAVTFVRDTVLDDASAPTPLVVGQAGRLLAAVTLSAFANTAEADRGAFERTDHQPVLLRRAVEFIETNAGNDIALADIADAVHVSSRAVQYMFRRHLDTTPLQYVRRLRLAHAHADLLAANPLDDTVSAIATRWGFAHTGRFAVQYRQTYGHSPHETLRD